MASASEQHMGEFFRSTKFKILAGVVAALLIGTVFAAVSHNGSSPVSSAIGVIFKPVQRLSSFVSDKLDNYSVNFRSSAVYAKEVEKLKKEVEHYQVQLIEFEQTKQKLKLYEEFLELKGDNEDYEFESANVIARDSADLYYSFVLNKGSSNGIAVNDPVIYGKHLVGVVESVKPTTCTVHTILDPKVNVSAYNVQSREFGYVTSTSEFSAKQQCYLPGLEQSTSITAGSIICTSGIGGIYPKDLIIGTVIDVLNDTHDVSVYALIDPGIVIPDLQDVFIITAFNGQGITSED